MHRAGGYLPYSPSPFVITREGGTTPEDDYTDTTEPQRQNPDYVRRQAVARALLQVLQQQRLSPASNAWSACAALGSFAPREAPSTEPSPPLSSEIPVFMASLRPSGSVWAPREGPAPSTGGRNKAGMTRRRSTARAGTPSKDNMDKLPSTPVASVPVVPLSALVDIRQHLSPASQPPAPTSDATTSGPPTNGPPQPVVLVRHVTNATTQASTLARHINSSTFLLGCPPPLRRPRSFL